MKDGKRKDRVSPVCGKPDGRNKVRCRREYYSKFRRRKRAEAHFVGRNVI